MTKIAIFASGAGSNADVIIRYFEGNPDISVTLIACNRAGAGVLEIARKAGIPVLMIDKNQFFQGDGYADFLTKAGVDFLVLAGFLWKIPSGLVSAYAGRIINIHPALLPAYGGKGMYGSHVHEAVIRNGEKASGITIHEVDEQYDHGKHLLQAMVDIDPNDSPSALAAKIHQLEHAYYPVAIQAWINNKLRKG